MIQRFNSHTGEILLNLSQYEIDNMTKKKGKMVFNISTNKIEWCDGSTWEEVGGGTSTTPVVIVPASESTITPVSASNSGDFRPYIGQVTVLNIVYSGTTGIVNLSVNDSSDCIVGDIIKMDRADNVANDGKFVIVEVTDTTHIVINNIAITDDSNNEYHANVFEGIQGKVLSKMIFNGCEYPYGIDGGRFNPDTPVDFSRYFTAKVPTESVGGTTFSLSVEYMTGTYHDETASTAGVYFKARAYTVKPGIIATLKGRTMGTYCSDQGTVLDIPLSPNTFFTEQSGLTVTVGDPYIAGDHLIIEVTRASTNAGDTLDNSIMVTSITVSCT